MIYWLIPYLVAYNGSDAGSWRYGPEHVFKAEVRSTGMTHNFYEMHSNVDMHFACRPMNTSLIQCRVESATIDNWSVASDGTSSSESHSPVPFGHVGGIVFQVEFNEEGVSKLWLTNAKGRYRHDMLRAIFDTVHWGIDVTGKKYGRYDRVEKSMIGSCETTFDIVRKTPANEETKVDKAIDGYSFDVPAFDGRTRNEPIVIEKNRNMNRCSEKTLYLFAGTDDEEFEDQGLKKITQVTSSRSRIYLGRNSFSGYTRNIGTFEIRSTRANAMRSFVSADGSIHLGLETIRPATEDIRQWGDSANAGTSFVTGTRWPKEVAPAVK